MSRSNLLASSVLGMLRTPLPYAVAGVCLLAAWAASALDVLALIPEASRSRDLWLGTLESGACVAAVLCAARATADDRRGDFSALVAASSAGRGALWAVQVGAAGAVALLAVAPLALAWPLWMQSTTASPIYMYSALISLAPALLLEVLALAAWSGLIGWTLGAWPGVAGGLAAFVVSRVAHDSPWLGWLPSPAAAEASLVEVARGALALLGPVALGLVAARGDAAPA
jgi:hypothetical protein